VGAPDPAFRDPATLEGPAPGVICAFSFRDGAAILLGEPDLDAQSLAADWTWTHLRLGDARGQAVIRGFGDLPEEARLMFLALETRVRIEQAHGWIYGVVPDFERDLSGRSQGEGRLLFALDHRRLLTARLHALHAVDDLRRAVEEGARLDSPAAALLELIEFYVELAENQLEALGVQIAAVEDYVLAEPQSPRETSLSSLRRSIARQRRDLQALRSALQRAHAVRHARRIDLSAEGVADCIARLDDADREAGALEERSRLLHEEIDTLINAATNRAMRTLAVISTLLIPPTLIVGAFGMNLPGMPFEHSGQGFAAASALCVAIVGLALWLLRRMSLLS
jgi:zinc transporter